MGRLQDSNAVLSHFNEFSENCFAEVSSDFARNTRLLNSMKSDLDYIFLKLRSMKAKVRATYPDAFPNESAREALDQRPDLEIPQLLHQIPVEVVYSEDWMLLVSCLLGLHSSSLCVSFPSLYVGNVCFYCKSVCL